MAFALTSFESDGIRYMGPGQRRAVQTVIMTITGAVTDVDLDIGDDAGTFWTAAIADATYGALATQALEQLNRIVDQAQAVARLYVPELQDRLQAAAASTTDYTLSFTDSRPIYTFAASNGEESYTVFIDYLLNENILPVASSYGVGA